MSLETAQGGPEFATRGLLNAINSATRCSVMLPPSAVAKGACEISSTPKACGGAAAVRSGHGPSLALGSKVLLADHPGITQIVAVKRTGDVQFARNCRTPGVTDRIVWGDASKSLVTFHDCLPGDRSGLLRARRPDS